MYDTYGGRMAVVITRLTTVQMVVYACFLGIIHAIPRGILFKPRMITCSTNASSRVQASSSSVIFYLP
jgi:hypothetical protein